LRRFSATNHESKYNDLPEVSCNNKSGFIIFLSFKSIKHSLSKRLLINPYFSYLATMFNLFKSKPILKDLIPDGHIDIHSHLLPGID
jgi:hypothetical protein